MSRTVLRSTLTAALTISLVPALAVAQQTYRVTVTNLTAAQILSPPVAATHGLGVRMFRPGAPASPGLAGIAEDADASTMMASLAGNEKVFDMMAGPAPIMPGDSYTFEIEAMDPYGRLSVVGMLVTTNDAFYGLDAVVITAGHWRSVHTVPAYDAGSEANNEDCTFIPGPPCGNMGVRDTAGAEGFVHVHTGIRDDGDVDRVYDWHNPVAQITVIRVDA